MNIIVLHPKIANESSEMLSKVLNCPRENPFEKNKKDYRGFNVVFNYGCNRNLKVGPGLLINTAKAVATCKDKVATLTKLTDAGIPCLEFRTNNAEVPKTWNTIIGREIVDGAQNKGMKYFKKGEKLPNLPLFTRYFDHKVELRVVVFKGKIVGRYSKNRVNNTWNLDPVEKIGFEKIDAACMEAAKHLEIDFVGFDILAKDQTKFKIIEANSAPIMTQEVANYIKKDLRV